MKSESLLSLVALGHSLFRLFNAFYVHYYMMFFIALLRGLHGMGCRVLCIEKSGIEQSPERRGEAESGIVGEYRTGSNLSLISLGRG